MAKYVLFRDYASFVPEYLQFGKVVSYQTEDDAEARDFYIITSEFKVLDYETVKDSIYLTLLFNNPEFLNIITTIDNLAIQDYCDRNNVKQRHLIRNFVPSRLLDPVSGQHSVLELIIPVVNGNPVVKVYDENSDQIPLNMIDVGFRGRAILQPKGIRKDQNKGTFTSTWGVEQLKVVIPEVYFDTCILNDENNDDVDVL